MIEVNQAFGIVQARTLLKKGGQDIPIEVLNNLGVLHFERGDFEVCQGLKKKLNFFIVVEVYFLSALVCVWTSLFIQFFLSLLGCPTNVP